MTLLPQWSHRVDAHQDWGYASIVGIVFCICSNFKVVCVQRTMTGSHLSCYFPMAGISNSIDVMTSSRSWFTRSAAPIKWGLIFLKVLGKVTFQSIYYDSHKSHLIWSDWSAVGESIHLCVGPGVTRDWAAKWIRGEKKWKENNVELSKYSYPSEHTW